MVVLFRSSAARACTSSSDMLLSGSCNTPPDPCSASDTACSLTAWMYLMKKVDRGGDEGGMRG